MAMRWPARTGAHTAVLRAVGRQSRTWRRSTHTVPTLDNHGDVVEKGIPGLFSAKGFKMAYLDYQQLMVDELNECTAGLRYETLDSRSVVIEFARNPTHAYAFNVASMAFNNHFFFNGINTNPDVQVPPSTDLQAVINKHFSSLDTLRHTFLDTAEAMFGPGFVWLVQTDDTQFGGLRILPTYLAGSPLSGAHWRRQSQDLNTHNPDSYQVLNKVGSFGLAAGLDQKPKKALGGVDVVPLLCVNTWEHVWLHDYGIRGKRPFLDAWWDKINWDLVAQNVRRVPPPGNQKNSFLAR